MRKYELTYLVSDEVPESELNKVTTKVTGFVTELKGQVDKEEVWGRRKLAYPIKKQDFATYVTIYFSLDALKVKEFDHEMRLNQQIVRHLLLVKDYGTEQITLSPDEIVATEEIAEIIGQEKAAELIEEPVIVSDNIPEKEEAKETETEEVESEPKVEEKTEEEVQEVEGPAVEEETVEVKEEEKPEAEIVKPKKAKKAEVSDEAERLSKLNEELDDILKDEL
ncbi:MAG: 30S ribosomal protein S6 [Candidatus Berkelbacteria bacterium]|nr:30S ribosomal protein S6 [Candidatus Berkelbacteria bacterium]